MPTDNYLEGLDTDAILNRQSVSSNPFKETQLAYKPFERYKGYNIDLSKSQSELEHGLSDQQTYLERLKNDLVVSGANAAAMFGVVMASTKDMITGDFSLDGTQSESVQDIYDWRKSVEDENITFESKFDEENPILSHVIPSFFGMGNTKGWGEILKSASYGVGAMAGVAAQEIAITAATQGVGTLPSLAVNIGRLLRLPSTLSRMGKNIISSAKTYNDIRKTYSGFKNSLAALDTMRAVQLTGQTAKFLGRGLAAAYGEAAFEGLEAKESLKSTLVDQYKNRFGTEPTGKELQEIEAKAQEAGTLRYKVNLGLLTLTGGFELNSIFKPSSAIINTAKLGERVGLKLIPDATTKGFKAVDDVFKITSKNKLWESQVGKLAKKGLEGTANVGKKLKVADFALMEGVEEFSQLWIDKSTTNYYLADYNRDVNNTVLNSVLTGLDESMSKEGFIAALTGIMGGSMQGAVARQIGNIKAGFEENLKEGKSVSQSLFSSRRGLKDSKLKQRKAFLENLDKINKVLQDTDLNEIANAVDVKSIYGTLSEKTSNTKRQTFFNLLKNKISGTKLLNQDAVDRLALYHQVKPFASNGLSDVYKDYLDMQLSDTIENAEERKIIKDRVFEAIDEITTIYDKVNNLFINPYSRLSGGRLNPKYQKYDDWKEHVVGFKFLENKYNKELKNIDSKLYEDSDILVDPKGYQKTIKETLNQKKESLSIFTQQGVKLNEGAKKSKRELTKEIKKLEKIDSLVSQYLQSGKNEDVAKILVELNNSEYGMDEYSSNLARIADLRISLNVISSSYKNLLSKTQPDEIVKEMEKKEAEAAVIEREIEKFEKQEKKVEEVLETIDDNSVVSKPTIEEVVEEAPKGLFGHIASKYATGIFGLEKQEDGTFKVRKGHYGNTATRIAFIETLFTAPNQLNLLDDYELIKVESDTQELIEFPMEQGLVANTKPDFHYAIVDKNDPTTEIVSFKSKDALQIKESEIAKLNAKTSALELKKGDTLYDFAVKLQNEGITDGDREVLYQMFYGNTQPVINVDQFIEETISHTLAVDKLIDSSKNEEEIKKNITNFFSLAPHITEINKNPKRPTYKASQIPIHYFQQYDKPVLIREGDSFQVFGKDPNGVITDITDQIKPHLSFNLKQTKNKFFAVVPSVGFDLAATYITTPLLRTELTGFGEQILTAFKKGGEAEVRVVFKDSINVQGAGLKGSPSIFVTSLDNGINVDVRGQSNGGTIKIGSFTILENEDGSVTVNNPDNLGFYEKVEDVLDSYPSLTSDLYYAKQPFSNYRVRTIPKAQTVEEDSVDVPEVQMSSIPEETQDELINQKVDQDDNSSIELPNTKDLADGTGLYEVIDQEAFNKVYKPNLRAEVLVKLKEKLLERGIIKQIGNRPSERNLKVLSLDIDTKIKEYLNKCHGLS